MLESKQSTHQEEGDLLITCIKLMSRNYDYKRSRSLDDLEDTTSNPSRTNNLDRRRMFLQRTSFSRTFGNGKPKSILKSNQYESKFYRDLRIKREKSGDKGEDKGKEEREENLSLNNSERRISFSELSRWANSSAGSFSSHSDRVIYEDDASVLSTVSISIYDAADFEPSRPQRLPSLEQDGIEMLAKSLIDNESLSQSS